MAAMLSVILLLLQNLLCFSAQSLPHAYAAMSKGHSRLLPFLESSLSIAVSIVPSSTSSLIISQTQASWPQGKLKPSRVGNTLFLGRQQRTVVKTSDYRVRISVCKSQFLHLLIACSFFTSLGLSFLICKMGIVMVYTS